MIDAPQEHYNPWANDDRALGSIANVLHAAEKTGHRKKRNEQALLDKELEEKIYSTSPSLRMIKLLKHITNTQNELNRVTLDIQCRFQDKETSDIAHLDDLQKRIDEVTSLSEHLQAIVNNKTQLIGRLQQPYVGDFMKIEATYHKYVSEVFPLLAPILSDLTSQLGNIEWARNVRIGHGELENILTDISSTLATLQTNFQSVSQMRQTLHDMSNV